MKQPTERRAWMVCGAVLFAIASAWAWHGTSHDKATKLAAGLLQDMPAFFVAGVETIAHCSADPDLFRLRDNPELRDAEVPEHYFDLELLGSAKVPPTRSAFVQFCAKKPLKPSQVGYLPYAVVEWTQRLTIAFAEHRKWPKDKLIQIKCLVYAGILSHYAQDACQPLHTTIHFDGRAKADRTSPRTGIHAKVDALLQKLRGEPKATAGDVKPTAFDKLLPAVVAEIKRSHRLVDKVYRLQNEIPDLDAPLPARSQVAEFAEGRLRACANFTACLYLTAWRKSARLELPEWHSRPLRAER